MGDVTTLATREILWNIPPLFKYIMYGLFVCSLAILAKGMYEKLLFVTKGEGFKGIKSLLPEKLNWSKFFFTSLLTGKVPRFKYVLYQNQYLLWFSCFMDSH